MAPRLRAQVFAQLAVLARAKLAVRVLARVQLVPVQEPVKLAVQVQLVPRRLVLSQFDR